MRTFSDEVMNAWADVFMACRLHQAGLSLEVFLEQPEICLSELGMTDALAIMASGYLPLLPAQARVRQEINGAVLHKQSGKVPSVVTGYALPDNFPHFSIISAEQSYAASATHSN